MKTEAKRSKWIPFLIPEHKELLKCYYQEVHHFKFEDTEELEMMEKSKTLLNDAIFSVHHHHGDGDERSIDASFHCLRRKA